MKRLEVEYLYLFGSTARDTATEDSGVDLSFDRKRGKLGLFGSTEVKEVAARILVGARWTS